MLGAIVGSSIGSIAGGLISADATRDAARAQAGASDRAARIQWQMYQDQRADQAPFRAAGVKALSGMQDADFNRDFNPNYDFQVDPGYQFRLAEGEKAINRAAAARGMANSGATLKSLSKFGQGIASDEYTNAYNRFNADRDRRFNRLSSLAGLGQTSTNQLGQAGQNFANAYGSAIMGGANARAAGIMGQANAINNTIGSLGNNWMSYSMMNKIFPQQGDTGGNANAPSGAYSMRPRP